MTGDLARRDSGGVAEGRGRRRWWQALRILLVVGWVAWAAFAWWSAPREAGTARARSDLSTGRLVSYEWAGGWSSDNGWSWTDRVEPRFSGRSGPLFIWRTTDWRVHYAQFDRGSIGPVPSEPFDAVRYSGPEAAAFDLAVQSANLQPRWSGVDVPPPLRALPTLLLLTTLAVLVLGPAPARGTRWCWLWVLTGVPFGLGLLWWLARERPWSPAEPPAPDPSGRDPRDRWYVGLLAGIATSIVVSLAMYGLRQVFGEWLVPPGAGS
ncbi:hypothetical protein [Micromonospora mirobrigensis]|nr:hypothetical protein [Micromonospora mirobrigensis]